MKMVKSLLLGTAAGFVAIAGAQAADLPVKAKPVQYVKICSLYGAGFYYIPGTDMCLKIGGWVRLEIGQNYNGSLTTGPMAGDVNNRTTNDEVWRSRGYITADARNQTEYGTVRSYIAVGLNGNDVSAGGDVISANRAFIQWAGFTFGLATSFYDFYASPATAYFGSYPGSDTGDGGQKVIGYTAQFGNGFSGTLAAEVARRTQVLNADSNLGMNFNQIINGAGTGFGVASPSSYEGFDIPDVVANLRVDQAWGSAQVMAAWHRVGANYYTNTTFFPSDGAGHPGNENGYAIGAGIKLLNPSWGPGDYLQAMISYTKGASKYNFQNPNFNHGIRSGDSIGFGVMSDAVYGGDLRPRDNTTSLNLTETLAINAAYEHFWNPAWRTSVYGGWAEVNYNDQANAMLCVNQGFGNGRTGTFAVALPGCDQDWSVWWVGTRTQWNVTKDFYMGLDVIYQKLNTMSEPDLARGFSQFRMTNFHALRFLNDDQDNLGFRFRVHRDFYP